MADKGWISLHRSIQDCPIWYGERFSKGQAWVDLLLLANHKDKKILFNGEMITVKRGQYLTSTVKLSEKWFWSRPTVVKFLKLLEKDKMIARDSDNTRTLITIENYEIYQRNEEEYSQPILQPDLQPPLQDSCNPINNPLYTNNNDNNVNNDNNSNKGGVGEKHSYEKNTNINNFLFYLETYAEKDYIYTSGLMTCLRDWFEYKDGRKPKSNNHYGTEKGIDMLLNKVVKNCKQYGVQVVAEVINDSIANNYQGIVWDWLDKKKGNNSNAKPERRNTRTYDVEIDPYREEILAYWREQEGV